MALYTIKEFADTIGKKPKDIHAYIARKKLIKNADKKIDTAELINDAFLKKYSAIATSKTITSSSEGSEVETTKPINGKTNPAAANEMFELDLLKKKLAVEKAQNELEIQKEDLKKKRGETIELESTVSIVKVYADSLKKGLVNDVQILIQDICARHGIDPGKAGEYKMKVNDIINSNNRSSIQTLLERFSDEG